VGVAKNGTRQVISWESATSTDRISHISGIFSVVEGDLISLQGYQSNGSAKNYVASLSIFTLSSSSVLIGGNSGSLISEQTLSADASTVTFSGLNSLVDGDYTLEVNIAASASAGSDIAIEFNGGATPTDYHQQYSYCNNGSAVTINGEVASNGIITRVINQIGYYCFNIRIISGKILWGGFAHRPSVDDMTQLYLASATGIYKTTVTSLTEIKLTGSATSMSAGSTFRLYGSKTPTQLVSYNPIDYANFSSDRLLRAGEVAYIDYSAATSVPLHIQTEEGLYELDIIGDITNAVSDSLVTLQPNAGTANVPGAGSILTYDSYQLSTAATTLTTEAAATTAQFYLCFAIPIVAKITISTRTKAKTVSFKSLARRATSSALMRSFADAYWNESTVAWTSLGTITCPSMSGKIVIRRII
jgi:hypothetical protein